MSQSEIYLSQENDHTQFLHKISYKKVWRGCVVGLILSENVENIVNKPYKVNPMNQTQENGYFWKIIIHKVLDHLKSNFDNEYFKSELRFWYAVFSADPYWSPLLSEQKFAESGENYLSYLKKPHFLVQNCL